MSETFVRLDGAVNRIKDALGNARGRAFPPAQIIAASREAKAEIDAITASIVAQIQATLE